MLPQGPNCNVDVNECQTYAGTTQGCQNGATCVNTPGSFTYICSSLCCHFTLLRKMYSISYCLLLSPLTYPLSVISYAVAPVLQNGTAHTAHLAMMTVLEEARTYVSMGCASTLTASHQTRYSKTTNLANTLIHLRETD